MATIEYYQPDGTKWPHVHCMQVAEDYYWRGWFFGVLLGVGTTLLAVTAIAFLTR